MQLGTGNRHWLQNGEGACLETSSRGSAEVTSPRPPTLDQGETSVATNTNYTAVHVVLQVYFGIFAQLKQVT